MKLNLRFKVLYKIRTISLPGLSEPSFEQPGPDQGGNLVWLRLYLRPNKIAIVTVGPHKLVLDRLVVMFRNLKEMYGSRGRGNQWFPPEYVENNFQAIQSSFTYLMHHPPKRRYKICTFSVILGELESSGNYKGFSYCHRHQSTNESPSSFKNGILDIHSRNIVPYILPAAGV